MLEECTQQVQLLRKELSHITFQDLKEKMIVLVAQVPCITLEPSKGNRQVNKIKGNFDQKVSHCLKNQAIISQIQRS